MNNELIRKLKEINIIEPKLVTLKNAGPSNFYVNIKKAYGYSEILNSLVDELWKRMDKKITCIAAGGYGGISPATLISTRYTKNLTLVRGESKEHGIRGQIEGYVPNKQDKIAIFDDVFTTGGSLREIIGIIKPTEAKIIGCYVFVKRREGKFEFPLTSILKLEDLL